MNLGRLSVCIMLNVREKSTYVTRTENNGNSCQRDYATRDIASCNTLLPWYQVIVYTKVSLHVNAQIIKL